MKLDRVYSNNGNHPLVGLLGKGCTRVLDIGCGAGDNAALLRARYPESRVYGITHTEREAELARRFMERCWVFDLEREFPAELKTETFDALIFSHVLEHLRDPASVLAKFVRLLRTGGIVVIAVPNILSWRQRIQFLFGRFEYEQTGVLDETHLRFYTFLTADRYLLASAPGLEIQFKGVTGSVPLWLMRRYILPRTWSECIDQWGCRRWPNLFGDQILIKAKTI